MIVLIRGGGDLASGVIYRLYHAGLRVVVTELPQPLAVRRLVSFADAVYAGEAVIEGIVARRVSDPTDTLRVLQILSKGQVPVLIDPQAVSAEALHPTVIVDARMTKQPPEPLRHTARLYVGLGPGFEAGKSCQAVVETQRGPTLGRVLWSGSPCVDSGEPEEILERRAERVLYAPKTGFLTTHVEICDLVHAGQILAEVDGQNVSALFDGVVRGLLRSGQVVTQGMKIGDVDPRNDPRLCTMISDKALAVGGGVLEAILSRAELRKNFWN